MREQHPDGYDTLHPHDWQKGGRSPESGEVRWHTCGTCGRSWDDAFMTGRTPTPAARCPFEYEHDDEEEEEMHETQFIFMAGNVSEGYKAYGPYSSFGDACDHHEGWEGWVMALNPAVTY